MKKFYKLLLVLPMLILCTGIIAYGQQLTVSGKVTDGADGTPLPGVNILEKGTFNGSLTDMDGKFTLKVNEGATLQFSFVGFLTEEVVVGDQTVIDVSLTADIHQLSEIVVIGYGTQKREDLTGSITAVDKKDFNKGAIVSPQELLMGRTPGVQITTQGGAPGAGAKIRIRGGSSLQASNDPLIVIDGVPIDNAEASGISNPFAVINPNDIETMTVLKDASATAIYGSRASNGVIMITTKRGRQGEALQLSYTGNVSMQTIPKYVDVLDADEYRQFVTDAAAAGRVPNEAVALLGNANTKWQEEIFSTAVSTDHNITATGNLKEIPYRASVGYTNQNGILETSNFKRVTVSLGVDPTFFDDHLKVKLNGKGMFADTRFANEGAIGSAVTFDPTQPVFQNGSPWGGFFYWPQDDPNGNLPIVNAPSNPRAYIDLTNNTANVNRYLANAVFDYKFHFFPDLRLNLNIATDRSTTDGNEIVSDKATWEYNSFGGRGKFTDYSQEKISNLFESYLKYEKELPTISSKVDAMAGYSYQKFWRTKTDSLNNMEGTYTFPAKVSKTENYLVSFYGRLNYTLLDRYLLTFTLRRDGSSRFAENNRWGTFPSAAFAWKLKEESFLKNSNTISELKLRLGYGVTGQQDISSNDYPALARVNLGLDNARYQMGSQFYNTLKYEAYDANIKWEETTTLNAGLDFGFLENRITATLDVYQRKTTNLINYIPVPLGTNFSNYIDTNVGDLENKGIELGINAYVVENDKWTWNAGVNFTYNENKITKLLNVDNPDYLGILKGGINGGVGNTVLNHAVGHSAFTFFLLEQVYDDQGNPIEGLYVDQNEDGIINDFDRVRYENPTPDMYMGFSSRINYGNFDFSFNARANIGNYVYNNVSSQYGNYANVYSSEKYLGNVTSDFDNANFDKAQYLSDYYLWNASFFKLDNITLGYRINRLFTDKINGYVNFTVQNALIISNYPGIDPEVQGGGNDDKGIDKNIYPRPRTYLLGFNINF